SIEILSSPGFGLRLDETDFRVAPFGSMNIVSTPGPNATTFEGALSAPGTVIGPVSWRNLGKLFGSCAASESFSEYPPLRAMITKMGTDIANSFAQYWNA